jgi:Ca2+-binding EF-hand superfamily protein
MNRKTLIALSVGAAFALPLTAQAGGDKASQGASASGAEQMFKSLDKNKDGYISRDEAKGTPHEKSFAKLDKNNDGKLSRAEHAAAQEHANDKAASGSTSNKKY